ncbi:MAG TPA: ABC transporter ATP-binding protein [Myxococcales bacterium]|nr:ABC transporter ATP-binding protein [Myxococcales bacterium]
MGEQMIPGEASSAPVAAQVAAPPGPSSALAPASARPPASAGAALEVEGLRKRFGGRLAVDGVSFAVRPGEIVALLGPNGAGKTTAMQLALGLLSRDEGVVRIFGQDPELLAVRRRLGFAPDAPLFPKALTGLQVLALHGRLLGLRAGDARRKSLDLAARVGFSDAAARPCGTYSRGQAQRLGLAQALLGEPALLFLDEPTAGLDPAGVAGLRELLLEMRGRGAAVLLNSHLLSEVERVCDRVLFIKGGQLLRTHEVGAEGRRAELRIGNPEVAAARLAQALPGGELSRDRFRIAVESEAEMPGLLRRALDAGAEVLEARMAGAELEELYLQIVEGRA